MSQSIDRRDFIKKSLLTPAAGALAMHTAENQVQAQGAATQSGAAQIVPASQADLPMGRIKDLKISRILLGGNLLTHFTHSRDLKYVYNLTAHYNTEEKIFETMALAEAHGVNTLVIHTAPGIVSTLKKYRYKLGGKIQWIICPTAQVDTQQEDYRKQVKQLVDEGCDAIYLWGKEHDVPCGVGAHDLKVIRECERNKIDADFYIKTFHHHNYPTAPKADELTAIVAEVPGYWCKDPQEVIDFMKGVEKPWFAFKVMAAGAIPPNDAFRYAFESGADFVLAGMFDFEIAEDVLIANR
ncbi:MAG: hypothetical protein ACYSUX_15710, partial [Planctomycetota bacterium]